MNEIKARVKRAQSYRRLLDVNDINTQWKWCINTGLWETAGWVGGDVIAWAEAHERSNERNRIQYKTRWRVATIS